MIKSLDQSIGDFAKNSKGKVPDVLSSPTYMYTYRRSMLDLIEQHYVERKTMRVLNKQGLILLNYIDNRCCFCRKRNILINWKPYTKLVTLSKLNRIVKTCNLSRLITLLM